MTDVLSNETLDDLSGRFITFHIGNSIYGIELLHVVELISIQSITNVPNVPDFVKGIINLRGKILPVIDVRLKLKMEERAYDDKTCIIVILMDDLHVGLIVDSISDVVTINEKDLASYQESEKSNSTTYLRSVSKVENRVILNLDCKKFLNYDLAT